MEVYVISCNEADNTPISVFVNLDNAKARVYKLLEDWDVEWELEETSWDKEDGCSWRYGIYRTSRIWIDRCIMEDLLTSTKRAK